MAHYRHDNVEPFKAASAISAFVPVAFLPPASSRDENVQRAGSFNEDAIGLTIATIATYGLEVGVVTRGRAKAIAAASLGAGALVAVGSTNGRLIPISPTGGPASANQVQLRFAVGRSVEAAVDGDVFTVMLDPKQVV